MSLRLPRVVLGTLIAAVIVSLPALCYAVFYELGPSKDEWGLKYDVSVTEADGGKMTVEFTLADEGRLKPIYSVSVLAFSKPDSSGGRTYDVKAPLALSRTKEGKRVGQVQIPQEYARGAVIRILTLNVNGQRQPSAYYYDIPVQKYLKKGSAAGVPVASPPQSKTVK